MTARNWDTWEFANSDLVVVVVCPGIKHTKSGYRVMWTGFVVAVKCSDWGMFGNWSWGAGGFSQEIFLHNGDWNYVSGKNEFVVWPRLLNLIPNWFNEEAASSKDVVILAGDHVVVDRFEPSFLQLKSRRDFLRKKVAHRPADDFEHRLASMYSPRGAGRASVDQVVEVIAEMRGALRPGSEILQWGISQVMGEEIRRGDFSGVLSKSAAFNRFSCEVTNLVCASDETEVRGLNAMAEHFRILRSREDRLRFLKRRHGSKKARVRKLNFFSTMNAVGKLTQIGVEV